MVYHLSIMTPEFGFILDGTIDSFKSKYINNLGTDVLSSSLNSNS